MTKRITIHTMITEDLGYCCEGLFFKLYKSPAVVAARLGVNIRNVRRHKELALAAGCPCEGKPNCMKGKTPRKLLTWWRQEQKLPPL